MKQLRKAVLMIMTAVMVIFALAPYSCVLAEEGEEEGPVLFVGGIKVTEENMYDILDDGGSAVFDPATGTLTLDEPVFGEDLECPILAVGMDLTIEGDATATGKTFGICVEDGVLTFKSGTVYAKGEVAVTCTALVVDGGRVIAEDVTGGLTNNYGVYVDKTADILSGGLSVTATGNRCRGFVARGGINVVSGTVTVNVNGKDDCFGLVAGDGDAVFSQTGTVSIQGGEVDITVNASKLDWPSFGSYGITAGDVIQISGGTVSVKSISEYNAYGLYGYADIASGSVTIRTEGVYAYGISANPWLGVGMMMSGGKLDVSAKAEEYAHGIDLEGAFTFSGGEILAKAEGENDGSTGINLSNEILISGGKITATGTGELSSGISCYVYGGNDQVTFEISGGEVNCTATGSGSDGIYSNQTMLISGGTVDSKGSKHGIYCEAKLTIGNGIVKVSSEGGSDAIDTHSDYYTGSITLGNELTIQKPGGGRLSDDGKTITESGGKVAKNVEIVNANEYAVVVNETENGTVTSSRTKANGGEKVTLTVTADENCRLTSISVKDSNGKDVPVNDSYEFTMPESDVTVTAVFTRYYAISIPDEAKDFISIEATESPAGEEVKVTLKDVDDYVIKGIKVTDSEGKEIEVENNTFVMPASDVTVTAVTARLYTITFELNGGTLNGDPGPVTMVLEEGSVIVLEKPVKEGYTFKYWEGSVYYAGDEYEVTEDHELGAVWEKIRVPDTGDSDRIFLYVWLLAVSAAFAAAVIFHRRKADRI